MQISRCVCVCVCVCEREKQRERVCAKAHYAYWQLFERNLCVCVCLREGGFVM